MFTEYALRYEDDSIDPGWVTPDGVQAHFDVMTELHENGLFDRQPVEIVERTVEVSEWMPFSRPATA